MEKFGDILKRLRWVSPGKNKILLCPRCGSRSIRLSSKFDAWLMPKRYVCEDCGYIGPIILEVDEEDGKIDHKSRLNS